MLQITVETTALEKFLFCSFLGGGNIVWQELGNRTAFLGCFLSTVHEYEQSHRANLTSHSLLYVSSCLGTEKSPFSYWKKKPFCLLIPSSPMVPIYLDISSDVFGITSAKGHWNSHFSGCFLLPLSEERKGLQSTLEENRRYNLPSACFKAELTLYVGSNLSVHKRPWSYYCLSTPPNNSIFELWIHMKLLGETGCRNGM